VISLLLTRKPGIQLRQDSCMVPVTST